MANGPGLRSGLSVYCLVAPTSGFYAQSQLEISQYVQDMSFSSAAPGGFASFSATLPLHDARIPRPEFALFSLIVVMSGPKPIWLGEVSDPEMGMDETYGEYVRVTGLGLGAALRDNPGPYAYTAQTVQQMVKDQLSRSTNGSPYKIFSTISTDTSLIFPDNPATTFSPVYDNRTMEEIVADVCQLAGDYQWGVWAHPTQQNAANFPIGQLSAQKRDTATTHYMASVAEQDVIAYTVTPSSDRAYNRIAVDYSTPTGGVGTALYTDSRLNQTSLAQNLAPFRYRRLVRDYSGTTTIGATQAQAIANTYGAQYKNPSNKITLTLQRVRDGAGNVIPLWEVLADHNIFIRDFAPRGNAPLPASPTATVNQFYIVNAEYREDSNGTQQLVLQCDNFADQAQSQIARLTLAADVASRTGKTTGTSQIQGAAVSGQVSLGQNDAVSGANTYGAISYPNQLYQAPTSISFSLLSRSHLDSPSASSLTTLGALVAVNVNTSGTCFGTWTYTTSGNCIRRVGRTRFDWHCDGCGKEFRGLALARYIRVETGIGTKPGLVALAIDCPECHAGERPFTESFNTALRAADEQNYHHHHRREQARLIRQMMRSGAVGLDVLP